jgi:phage tail sheath protein FI
MAVQVSYPGVYIQEIPSGVRTITGVSTSIGAFIGRASKGPIDKAVRLLSYADYERSFGEPHGRGDIARSVRLFFDNGGTDCYVVRIAHNAEKADVTLKSLDGVDVLKARAKDAGTWGNALRLEVSYDTPTPDETFSLRVVQMDGETEVTSETIGGLTMDPAAPRYAPDFVSQSSSLIDLVLADGLNIQDAINAAQRGYSEGRRPLTNTATDFADLLNSLIHAPVADEVRSRFEMSVNDGPWVSVDLQSGYTLFDNTDSDLGNQLAELQSRINTALGDVVPGVRIAVSEQPVGASLFVPRMTSDTDPFTSVRIRRGASKDLAASLMLGLDQGGIEVSRFSELRPAPTASVYDGAINSLANLAQSAINEVTLSGQPLDLTGQNTLVTTVNTDPWFKDGGSVDSHDHNDGVREKLNIIVRAINDAPDLPCRAELWGYRLALIPTAASPNGTVSVTTSTTDIGADFKTNVRLYTLGNAGTGAYQVPGIIGQDDDGNPPDAADYQGSESAQSGFHALDPVDLFNLMIIPGDEDVVQATFDGLWDPASVYCQARRAFLLVDPPPSWTNATTGRPDVVQDTGLINTFRSTLVKQNAAIFYPRLRYSDNGLIKTIGSAGAIAGLMARTDANRGVWKAPAGIDAGVRGIVGLNVELTDAENGVLNKKGVNCIRALPNGIVNWGARTLDGDDDFGSEWKYIPIRRFALFLEESLYRGTRWVVFEPNDEPLWANIRLNLNAFMFSLFRQQAFQGSSPQEAYFIRCDKTTTTQDDRNKGIVNIEVGFAPLKPAEFVVIKIQQMAGEL